MRLRTFAPPLAALLAAACGPSHQDLQRCAAAADCAADAFCRDGRCIASASPIAVVTAPPARPLRSHTVLRFDGSLSHDPDPEDRVVSFAWTFRKVAAGCDPWPPAASGQAADVVFGCGGSFEAALTVTDATGHASTPAVLPVTIELSADVPSVAMGADVAVEHRCQGSPLRCGADLPAGTPLQLSATASSPVSTAFTYAWSVALPPGLAGQPVPRVTIDPPGSPTPAVTIETDGTALSGEYLFTVAATDAYHLVAVGQQRIALGNRPPAIAGGGPLPVPHTYDAAGSRFLASADLPAFAVSDPDGDPVSSLGFTWAHAGDGPGTFDVQATAWTAHLDIAVPYAAPADALHLIGGAGLSRSISFAAVDVNGGRADVTWDVQVANHRPRLTSALGAVTVDHGFDAAAMNYVADAPLAGIVDDDGDPIVQAAPTGSPLCPVLAPVAGGGTLTARCLVSYAGAGSMLPLLATQAVAVQVADPWSTLVAGSATVTVLNRPPVVAVQRVPVPTTCAVDLTCCDFDVVTRTCLDRAQASAPASAAVPPPAWDPDGDPLDVGYTSSGCISYPLPGTCPSAGCPVVAATTCPAAGFCGVPPATTLSLWASDGVATATGSTTIAPACL